MNNLESDDETGDTPLVSPFPHSDNDSDDGEVLNELIEYENTRTLLYDIGEVSNEDMHSFDPTREIANSSICIFSKVKFSSHDPVVHHLGHDVKRRVEVNVSLFDMHVSNIAWEFKVVGASFYNDMVSK
ncbi:hypothetical protein Tco_0632714, partial [Tanacetum coccineum]